MFGKGGIAHQVGDEFDGARHVARWKDRVDERFFFGCVGIEFAAHALHSVQNVPRFTAPRAFEDGMLHEVCQPEASAVVAASCLHSQPTISHASLSALIDDAQTVGKRVVMIGLLHCLRRLRG